MSQRTVAPRPLHTTPRPHRARAPRRRYLRLKEHTHTFVNEGGHLGELDFRFPIGAPISGLNAFARTQQLGVGDKLANALRLGTSPIVAALVNFDVGMDMVRALTLTTM